MVSRWEEYTIGPESVGLTELEWDTLRVLMEGNGLEFFPAEWEGAIPVLLERELVASTHGKTPTLNSRDGPRGTQSHQGTVQEVPGRPGYFVTPQGHTVLAQVGTFRRAITTVDKPVWSGWRRPWRPCCAN